MEGSELSSTSSVSTSKITVTAKYGKEKIILSDLPHSTRISTIKELLQGHTNILPFRQKLVGLTLRDSDAVNDVIGSSFTSSVKRRVVGDDHCLCDLKVKYQMEKKANPSSTTTTTTKVTTVECILMGTPEDQIFVDPAERRRQWGTSGTSLPSPSSSTSYSVGLPEVIDDFDLDFTADSELWVHHVANQEKLKASIDSTTIHIMNPPRPSYPLLVLDLDHTLLDFSSTLLQSSSSSSSILTFSEHNIIALPQQQSIIAAMKRPYMDQFLSRAYRHYDIVVWSQTSWRWLETKLIELGMLSHPHYRFCFVLDKTSMFPITSFTTATTTSRQNQSQRDQPYTHHVKPLQLIWSKFSFWMEQNTIHIDDLARNFALNSNNGLQIAPYYRKKKHRRHTTHHRRSHNDDTVATATTDADVELVALSVYLERLAVEAKNEFHLVDFAIWRDVVSGLRELKTTKK